MAGAKVKKAQSRSKSKAKEIMAEINAALKLEESDGLRLGSDAYFTIERIPTGSLVLDRITGGGFALGRHYELFGDENSGKSTIAYMTIALAQQRGKLCAVIDPEHSFDNERFQFLGGNSDELLMLHPQTAEDAVAVMMMLAGLAAEQKIEVILIDSVSSLLTMDEKVKDPREEDRIATQARMMSRALRRITTVNKKTLFIWTNQERINVGVKFGNPRTTSGGRALRYYSTGRIEFRRGSKLMGKATRIRAGKPVETDVEIGRWVQILAVKDKSTIPLREGAFVFHHMMKRIDPASEIVQLGLEDGLIERSANGRYAYVDLDGKEWKGTERQFYKLINSEDALRDELVWAIQDASAGGGES